MSLDCALVSHLALDVSTNITDEQSDFEQLLSQHIIIDT